MNIAAITSVRVTTAAVVKILIIGLLTFYGSLNSLSAADDQPAPSLLKRCWHQVKSVSQSFEKKEIENEDLSSLSTSQLEEKWRSNRLHAIGGAAALVLFPLAGYGAYHALAQHHYVHALLAGAGTAFFLAYAGRTLSRSLVENYKIGTSARGLEEDPFTGIREFLSLSFFEPHFFYDSQAEKKSIDPQRPSQNPE